MKNELLPGFLVAAGLLSIAASVANWDWFFDNWRARHLTELLGRNAARVLHLVLGLLLTLGGAYMLADRNSQGPGSIELRAYSPPDE